MFCVMCAIDIFLNKIMKSKFCVKKCQENVLQFMFLYIIRTPLLELKSVGKKCGLYTGKDGTCKNGKTMRDRSAQNDIYNITYIYIKHIKMFQQLHPPVVELSVL